MEVDKTWQIYLRMGARGKWAWGCALEPCHCHVFVEASAGQCQPSTPAVQPGLQELCWKVFLFPLHGVGR